MGKGAVGFALDARLTALAARQAVPPRWGCLRQSAASPPGDLALDLRPSTFDLRPSTFDLRPSTFDLRPSTFDLRPSTFDL
ncbi:MAG: hypothetical protein K8R57_05845, partial [Verrucomicrobia bacterium]|nr:hypothetical protein [Verrucomicrobiota bacterium]